MSKRHEVLQLMARSILIVLCLSLLSEARKHPTKVEYDGKVLNVPINPDKITDLYQHWMDQMFSGLFAAVATKRLKDQPEHVRDGLEQCSKNSKSVILHAKCVSALLNNKFDTREFKVYSENKKQAKKMKESKKNSQKQPEEKHYQAFAQEMPEPTTFTPLKLLKDLAKAEHVYSGRSHEIRRHPTRNQSKRMINIQTLPSGTKIRRKLGNPTVIPRDSWEAHGSGEVYQHSYDHRGARRVHTREGYASNVSKRLQKLSYHKTMVQKPKQNKRYYYWPGFDSTSRVTQVMRRRMKRGVIQKNSYELKSQFSDMTPIGAVAKLMSKALLVAKNKTSLTPWQVAVERIKDRAKVEKELRKKQKEAEKDNLDTFAFRGLKREGIDVEDIMDTDPKKFKDLLKDKRMKDAAKDPRHKLISLLRDGVKLGYSLTGRNTTDFDDKTLKAFSPRLMSVVPEQEDDDLVDLLSPSLFSLHNKGQGIERLTSLPNMVKGFSRDDQQEWMNFIIEAAGVNEQAEKLEKDIQSRQEQAAIRRKPSSKGDPHKALLRKDYTKEMRTKDGKPLYFTKENVTEILGTFEERKISTWEKLVSTYSKEQHKEMNETGYTTLTYEQLHLLYGPQSPFNDSEALGRLTNMSSFDVHNGLERDIHRIAMLKSFDVRQKDITLSPIVLTSLTLAYPLMNQPIVLSPVVLSPVVLTPAVLGPVVLSPWVFIPVILSPRVLSPLILNPLIFSPIVLSPLVLHPLVLSPGVFNPIVLTPLVLSPFILSPQVFTPVILSPMVLNPLILNPMVGSPLVLSPFVLSPVILSPQALFGVVLSPYALSPLVESKLILATVFLSPSWLS